MQEKTASRLEVGHLIPPFSLRATTGEPVSPWDYKEKKALLILFIDPTNSTHLAALADVSKRYHEFADVDAEVLVVASGPIGLAKACVEGFRPPFHILSDEDGRVRYQYGVSGLSAFVTDRFGELKMALDVGEEVDTVLDKAIRIIELSELECPECGAPTWPAS